MLTLIGLWLLLLLWDNVSDNGEVSQACNVTDRQTDSLQICTVLCGAAVLSLAEAFVLGEGRRKKKKTYLSH